MKKKQLTTRLAGLVLATTMLLGFQAVSFGGGCNSPCQGAALGLGCGGHGAATKATTSTTGDESAAAKKAGCPHTGAGNTVNTAADVDDIFTAKALYNCPMHAEMVSTDAEAVCGACNMNLRAMNDKQIHELRHSAPKGCSMCSVVMPGDAEETSCSACGMKLMPLNAPALAPDHPETGM
jgi:hypothetical protein